VDVGDYGDRQALHKHGQKVSLIVEVFPFSLFWFAWTTYTSVHWIVPIIASAFYGWSFYTTILMTFIYI